MTSFELLTMGRVGVDLYPQQTGPLRSVRTFAKSLGGTATNVAVAAARLGHRSAVITAVGDDDFGRYVREALTGFGVDPRYVQTDPDHKTPIVFAVLDPPEEPGIVFYREPMAPDMTLAVDQLDHEAIRTADIFWMTGTGLSAEPSRSATLAALELRPRGAETIFDLDFRPAFWRSEDEARDRYAAAFRRVSVAVGNRREVAVAVGSDDPEEGARRLLALGVRLAIVKLGGDGVLVADGSGTRTVPAARVDVVNGLGAGDAFGGALCHGLLLGWDPAEAVRYANAAGAIVAARLACADDMPTDDEVQSLLRTGRVG